jgi:hypothetical protein
MVKESTQNALERFFPQLGKEYAHMSQQAFSAARQKVKWEAFDELFRTSVSGSYNEECKLWRGFRILAADGSFIRLPMEQELIDYYGALGHEGTSAAALASVLYDVENDIIVDAKIEPIERNERSLAAEHIEALMKMGDFQQGHRELLIFDRGYPSYDFIKSLEDKEIAYVMRVQKGFIREEELGTAVDRWVALGKSGKQVRTIVVDLGSEEREILITNLPEAEMEYKAFKELYHKRWGIETKYKTVKQKLELENFSGRLVENIKQDFYAMMTVSNMIASCRRVADRKVKKDREGLGNKYEYQVNVNHAIGVYKDRLIRIIIEEDRVSRRHLMNELLREMERRVVPIRPNREVVRKNINRKAKFHHNHKSNC